MSNFKEWLASMSRASRAGLIAGVAVIIALFITLSYWTLSKDYQVLFAELDPQDGSMIISELDRMKIPYRLEDGGKTILVEKDHVYKTRLKLMGKGVNLKGTVGFEIFNEADFGMTDFAQRINYQRALQGEIARTIMALEEVESARVHLVVPESGFLKKSDKQPKASITITTKPGHKLAQDQVLGIQRLVAAAVPDIDASAVTILDSRGVALTKTFDKNQESAQALENKLTIKQQTEEYFTQKIVSMLDKTFGPGKAIVSVDVTLNHDSLKITREDVLPAPTKDGDVDGAVSRRKVHSKRDGNNKKSASSQGAQGGDESMNELTNDEIEYMHGRKIEQLVSNPGSIKQLSVGVILPNNVDPSRLEMLSKVIAMSVGLNTARGDALAIYPLERFTGKESSPDQTTLSRSAEQTIPSESTASKVTPEEENLSINSALVLVLLLVIATMLMLWQRRSHSQRLSLAEREKTLKEIQQWLVLPHAAPISDSAPGNM